MNSKTKHIPFPDIPDARQLTPMEMNNLHFTHPSTHSTVVRKTEKDTE